MAYDFDTVVNRHNTSSVKWDLAEYKRKFNSNVEDPIPFGIADMDFLCPPQLIKAMVQRAEHGVYGYTGRYDDYYDAVIRWMKRRHQFTVEKEDIIYSPGIVTAVNIALQAYCEKGDKVIIQPPVYYPFEHSINRNELTVLNNELIYENGRYCVDFNHLESLAKDPKAKLFILCSPHNPSGRVFTKEELKKMGDICIKHNVLILADEIHHDLVYEKGSHTVVCNICKDIEDRTILCTATSKTFNTAGLTTSSIIIKNEDLRQKYIAVIDKLDLYQLTPFGNEAMKVCYNECEDWLDELLLYLQSNINFMEQWLKENLKEVKLVHPEATYLGWLDFSYYTKQGIDIYKIVNTDAGVGFHRGAIFGPGGEDFMRVCFACPQSVLKEGFKRIKNEIDRI